MRIHSPPSRSLDVPRWATGAIAELVAAYATLGRNLAVRCPDPCLTRMIDLRTMALSRLARIGHFGLTSDRAR
jgi:hypothetical protein